MAARRSVADEMDASVTAGVDPDYLFFLRHLYPDGASCVLEVPAADGVSPPVVVKYDGARGAGVGGEDEPESSSAVIDPPSPPPQISRRATGRPATGARKK